MYYSKEDILKTLNNLSPYTFFLDLEHGYCHTAGSRISLYADDSRWAIVFEKSGYANRGSAGAIELNYFGNCLINLEKAGENHEYSSNSKVVTLIAPSEFDRIQSGFELVAQEALNVNVRDVHLPIEHDPEKYRQKGIPIITYNNPDHQIDFPSLIRYLEEENPEIFKASDEELALCLPKDLPKIFEIDTWHHISYGIVDGPKPSEIETFQLIADILISKDTTIWKPTLPPNNDWRNWPKAGGL